jgi:CHAT domain-containing protein/tetratricopeptide (TPR) repeat protein
MPGCAFFVVSVLTALLSVCLSAGPWSGPAIRSGQARVEDNSQEKQPSATERLKQTEAEESRLSPEEAGRRYQALFEEFEALKQPLGMGRAKLGLARLVLRSDPRKAAELGTGALKLIESANDPRYEAVANRELGIALAAAGDSAQALRHYEAALRGFRHVKDSFLEGRTLNGMGNVHLNTGFYQRASESYGAAYRIARDTGNDTLLGMALNNQGELYWRMGRYLEALDSHQQSLALKLRAKDQPGAARSYNGLGNVYFRLGNYDKALEHYRRALDIFQTAAPSETAVVLSGIGTTLMGLGRHQEALQYLDKAYEAARARKDLARMALARNDEGYVHSLQGRYGESLKRHQEALELATKLSAPEGQLHALQGMGFNLFLMGRYPEAFETFGKVVALSEQLRNTDEMVLGHVSMGRVHEQLRQVERARAEYQAAIDTIESARSQIRLDTEKAEYLENNLEAYTNLVRLLARRPETGRSTAWVAEAFSYAERLRARALLELLAESRSRIAARVDPATASELESLQASIAVLQGQIRQAGSGAAAANRDTLRDLYRESDRLYDAYRLLEAKVRKQDPGYVALQAAEPVSLSALQAALPSDAILLEYVFDHRRNLLGLPREPFGVCFAVTRDKALIFEIGSVAELPELVIRFRESLTLPAAGDLPGEKASKGFTEAAEQLYRLLVAPAGDLLLGKQRMIVVPDRFLTVVPFEALLTDSGGGAWGVLPYLVRKASISYSPSATIYVQLSSERRAARADKDLLAIGDPVYEGEGAGGSVLELIAGTATHAGFQRLPHTAEEATAVAALFPADRRDLLLREQATEDRFRELIAAHRYSHVLFSVHGVTSAQYPQFASLVLSKRPNSPHDGLLQVHEIYNLRVPADLVVLSACETALGRNLQGEGLVGLVRAFIYSGARAVVASLWRVEDLSTSRLMAAFFSEFRRSAGSKADALRQAQLQMLGDPKHSHPFFWAGFILSGARE